MPWVLLLFLTVWFGGDDGDPQAAARKVFKNYDYQRELLPEPPDRVRPDGGSGGGSGRTEVRPEGDDTPRTGNETDETDDKHWSRESWHEQMERRDPNYRRLPDRRADRERRRNDPDGRPIDVGGADGLVTLLKILVFTALGVAILTVIVSILRNWGRKQAVVKPQVGAGVKAPQAELDAPRSEAEALADEGRFDEAVHVLLLKTIEALMRTLPGGVPEAWTSREIQREVPMPEAARAPFGALVDQVEQSLFGGLPVDREAWDTCLARFREFETAYRSARR